MKTERRVSARAWLSSIRTKLLLYAAAVLILPTLVYGILAFTAAREALEPALSEELADDVAAVRVGVQVLLAGHIQNVRTWAELDIMRELVFNDLDKTISSFLERIKGDYGVYLDLIVVDNDGACVASSSAEQIGRSYAIEAARLVGPFGDIDPQVAYSEEHGEFYIGLARRIPDPDHPGMHLGTLIAMLDRSALDVVVRPTAGHGHVRVMLVDSSGRILSGPDYGRRQQQLARWARAELEQREYVRGQPPVVYRTMAPDGKEMIVAEVPIDAYRTLPDLDWIVVGVLPRALTLGPVVGVRDRVFLLGAGVTLIGLAIAWLLSSNISRPIKELTHITSRIADEGILDEIPDSTARDEVGELTRSFQTMVHNVSEAHREVVQSAKLAFLGELAAGMAHEIRTPIGIIKNSAQLLERRASGASDTEGMEFARFIYEESDRLSATLNELLNFARPPSLYSAPTDVNALVERTVQFLSSQAESRGVAVVTELADTLPEVECDGRQIYQVLINLVMNALQACDRGDRVTIRTELSDGQIKLTVVDTGPGIPAAILDSLFTPFVSQRVGGIGLGLAVVKRIVMAHRGRIEACNEPGGGARFTVWLPYANMNGGETT